MPQVGEEEEKEYLDSVLYLTTWWRHSNVIRKKKLNRIREKIVLWLHFIIIKNCQDDEQSS
jgi:hypothetical protein